MQTLLAFTVGGLVAAAVFLLLRRSLAKIILGLALLTNAVNLLIFTVGGLTRAAPPITSEGADAPALPVADPLPQALILTAIVIGFGVLAFMMVLAYRAYQEVGSDDLDRMVLTDALPTHRPPAETHDEERASQPAEPGLLVEA
jgi:multicomponent Na+:H+ antiporter subunit C